LGHKYRVVIIKLMGFLHKIYARTSTELVRKAIVANDRHNFESQTDIYQEEEKADLMNFLKNLR